MRRKIFALTASLLVTAAIVAPTTAAAAEPALAAPGGPFRVPPKDPPQTVPSPVGDLKVPPETFAMTCSQGPTGTLTTPDGKTQRVMLTASHCVNTMPGLPEVKGEVFVPLESGYARIGERIASNVMPESTYDLSDPILSARTADWGIVLIDDSVNATRVSFSRDSDGGVYGEPVELTGIRDLPTLQHGEIVFDNFGQPICKDGATSGRSCGTQLARTRNGIYSWDLYYLEGDSGGVNFDPRDGAILGVTSMALGPLGKLQPADRILEDAYGIPDGEVNNYFVLTDSTAPHTAFVPSGEESVRIDAEISAMNPDIQPPDGRAELETATANAQQDARQLGEKALGGNIDPREIQNTAEHHAGEISKWADVALAQEINSWLN
ncbi:hypothetical protein CGLAU_01280 [Corynebacterium glaucum]|uniref:Trypsin n=1 Tax=Corynebacterium glaucum TaxID=187491 RepID=A0A1Q2HTS5_9CORY|nr:hypothetical protein [Corynebacterium glaucum]AQQ14247.1 hypothetical protein CGLAU_01280 [Corynebacterium glaucum]WJZ06770.1 hypothetical protein CGLAUT_01300 [Corynebacterium glaucum]